MFSTRYVDSGGGGRRSDRHWANGIAQSLRHGDYDDNGELLEAGAIGEQHDRYLPVRRMQDDSAKQPRKKCEVLLLLQRDGCPHRGGPGLLFILRRKGRIREV